MFYNKDIFAQSNLDVPTTWDELMAACDTLAQAGFAMPIGLGGADKIRSPGGSRSSGAATPDPR